MTMRECLAYCAALVVGTVLFGCLAKCEGWGRFDKGHSYSVVYYVVDSKHVEETGNFWVVTREPLTQEFLMQEMKSIQVARNLEHEPTILNVIKLD